MKKNLIFGFECSAQLPDGHQIHSVLSRCSDGHQNHSVLCREMQRTVFCPFDFAGSESILLDFLVFRRSHCHSVTDYYSWNFYFFSGAAVTVSLIIAPTFFNISQKRLSQCHWSLPLDFLFFHEATVTVSLISNPVFFNFFLKPLSQCHWSLPIDFLFFSWSHCHSVTDYY